MSLSVRMSEKMSTVRKSIRLSQQGIGIGTISAPGFAAAYGKRLSAETEHIEQIATEEEAEENIQDQNARRSSRRMSTMTSRRASILDKMDESDKASFGGTVANIILMNLGTGILSMPKNQAAASVALATVMVGLLLFLNYISVMLITRAAEKHQVFELEEVLLHIPHGKVWYYICMVALYLTFGFALISYMIAFSDSGVQLCGSFVSTTEYNNDKRASFFKMDQFFEGGNLPTHTPDPGSAPTYDSFHTQTYVNNVLAAWVSPMSALGVLTINGFRLSSIVFKVIGGILVYPLCFLSQKWLGYFSMASILINIFIVIAVIINFATDFESLKGHPQGVWAAGPDICMFGLGTGPIGFMSSVMMTTSVQPCLVPMYQEMRGRSVKKFAKAMKIAMFFCFVLFMVFNVFGHFTYGDEVKGNILKNMAGKWYSYINDIGIMFVLLCIYPLTLYPMKQPIKSKCGKVALTSALVVASIILALCLNDLDVVNNICGASSSFFFLTLFPGLLAIQALSGNKVAYSILIVFGFVCMILGFIWPSAELKWRSWEPIEKRTWYSSTEPTLASLSGAAHFDFTSENDLKMTFDARSGIIPLYPAYHSAVVNAAMSADSESKSDNKNPLEKLADVVSDLLDGTFWGGNNPFNHYTDGVREFRRTKDDKDATSQLDDVSRNLLMLRIVTTLDKNLKAKIDDIPEVEARAVEKARYQEMRDLIEPDFRDKFVTPEKVIDMPYFVLSSSPFYEKNKGDSKKSFVEPFASGAKYTTIEEVTKHMYSQFNKLVGEYIPNPPEGKKNWGHWNKVADAKPKTDTQPAKPAKYEWSDINYQLRLEFLEGQQEFAAEMKDRPRFTEADTYTTWRQEMHGNYKDSCMWRLQEQVL
eukprot:TRINITY_DN25975_c0_g1_i1.p1 TRINITY_DN25975_c0_g1~~TRINITY_DN25975_c0_g1_i1.p1  ORF type:complete len:874 (+),score=113.75 TRINITY_DN25975_c0_g1_i1:63-2684(+)